MNTTKTDTTGIYWSGMNIVRGNTICSSTPITYRQARKDAGDKFYTLKRIVEKVFHNPDEGFTCVTLAAHINGESYSYTSYAFVKRKQGQFLDNFDPVYGHKVAKGRALLGLGLSILAHEQSIYQIHLERYNEQHASFIYFANTCRERKSNATR